MSSMFAPMLYCLLFFNVQATVFGSTGIYIGGFIVEGIFEQNITLQDIKDNYVNETEITDAVLLAECEIFDNKSKCQCKESGSRWSELECQDYRCCILSVSEPTVLRGEFTIDNITSNADLQNLTDLHLYHSMKPTGKITDAVEVAECRGSGNETECECMSDHIWTSTVCENHTHCCNNPKCKAEDLEDFTPMCLPKVNVKLTGKVKSKLTSKRSTASGLDSNIENVLKHTFQEMSGLKTMSANRRQSAEFSVTLEAVFKTVQLQKLINKLQDNLSATIEVESVGIVEISKLSEGERYELSCDLEDQMGQCSWLLKTDNKEIVVGPGIEIKMDCVVNGSSYSKTTLLLKENARAGLYTCRLTSGSISHKASVELDIPERPDIIMESEPQTADCTEGSKSINVSCEITSNRNDFNITLSCPGNSVEKDKSLHVNIPCDDKSENLNCICKVTHYDAAYDYNQTVTLTVPVLKSDSAFCAGKDEWPKTKVGSTATQRCEQGRVGYKSRTCVGKDDWGIVSDYCVREDVENLIQSATDIADGYGNTPEEVGNIFSDMTDVSSLEKEATLADVEAFINILDALNTATSNIVVMNKSVMTDFVESASNVLSMDWSGANKTHEKNLSVNYLQSLEGLLQNIQVNQSLEYNTTLLQLQVRQKDISQPRTVFDVTLSLSTSAELVKILAIKNLSDLLPVSPKRKSNSLVVTVALQSKKNETSTTIDLVFNLTQNRPRNHEIFCVNWQNSPGKWGEEDCNWIPKNDSHAICQCFLKGKKTETEKPGDPVITRRRTWSLSALVSGHAIVLEGLDLITLIGLGASTCSLVIFIFVEVLVWKAVTKTNIAFFRHTALVNIATFLLLANIIFFVTFSIKDFSKHETWCLVLALAMHFSYLVMFFWMFCLSMMLLHQLMFVFSPVMRKTFFFLSVSIGYICPMVTVSVTYAYYNLTDGSYYDPQTCWLKYEGELQGSIHAFLFPVGVIVLINLFTMIKVIVTHLRPKVSAGTVDEKEIARSILKVIAILTPVFGVSWALGFLVFLMDLAHGTLPKIVNYAFTITTSLQGFFILLTGILGETKVQDEVSKYVSCTKPERSESTRNLTSSSLKKN
ncbi:adhesion G-protein coupled receptor F3-like isoform X2 [Sardina pilchardus]|uniref:adhesion G-protein coupled receptor F3-like isoform X2 n=1 Tax=Sardina pilchardus TaxID=27697 RepID=UPI002E117C2F